MLHGNGLVNIPIALYPATRKEELKFRLLRKTDLSPINYKRVAEKDVYAALKAKSRTIQLHPIEDWMLKRSNQVLFSG